MTNQRAVSDSFRIGRDDIYTCLYLFFNQSGRIPVVHANRCINMYYNRLYNIVGEKPCGEFSSRKFHPFYTVISIKLHNFVFVNISLAERSSLFHNIFLSTLPINQSESSIENVSLLHFYRLQAVCDFLWRIPSADTSLHERNSEMISVYSQRPTHESLRISSTNSPDCLTFRIEMTGIILFFTEFCCRISYFS